MNINIPNATTRKKRIVIIIASLTVVVIGAATWWLLAHYYSSEPVDTSDGPSQAEIQAEQQANLEKKREFIESTNLPDSQTTTAPTDTADKKTVDVTLRASQQGATVVLKTELTDFSDGTCTVSITNESKSYSDTVDIIYTDTYSTCAGFSIPVDKLGTGTWRIQLSATNSTLVGTAAKDFEVRP